MITKLLGRLRAAIVLEVQMDDFEALREKLHDLSGKVILNAERKALKKVGNIVKAAIVERTPVKAATAHGVLEAGELKASIKARVSVPKQEAFLSGKQARVVIGPVGKLNKLIAHDVEYGHDNPTAKGKALKRTPAHPFIRPAADAAKAKALAAFKASMIADIKKAMKKNG